MHRTLTTLGTALGLFVGAPASAAAAPPTIVSVGHQDRHPTATFGALPGVDDATIYMATSPDRASDGSFLSENVADVDFLTDEEIQSAHWLYEGQLDPGSYYLMLRASDYECSQNPSCIDGLSNVMPLTIPKPPQKYAGKAQVYRFLGEVTLTLKITPLGDDQPYRVCWRRKSGARRCLRGTVEGYSWSSSADDSLDASTQRMRRRTRFTWYVGSRRVASKVAKVR